MIFGKGGYILCEGCSKQLNIVSDFSAICVCSTCGNVNQKHEPRISVAVGKMQEDVSVIQIGAKGTAQGSEILVTGRYRIETDSGYYNLWSVDVKKTGELAWLIDSMGEYIFASQHNHKYNALPEVKMWNSNTGKYFMLPALGSAKLITNKKVIYRNIEGEVGKMPLHIEHCYVYDLRAGDDDVVFIIKTSEQQLYYLQGKTISWGHLNFSGIRNIDIVANG